MPFEQRLTQVGQSQAKVVWRLGCKRIIECFHRTKSTCPGVCNRTIAILNECLAPNSTEELCKTFANVGIEGAGLQKNFLFWATLDYSRCHSRPRSHDHFTTGASWPQV